MIEWKFNYNQLKDLDRDMEASKRAIPIIVAKVLSPKLRELRNQLRALIPHATGKLARSFTHSVRRRQGLVSARLGFMTSGRVSASTAIAANVLQAGGAHPRKGVYLWIPLPPNRSADGSPLTSARDLLGAGGFIQTSKAGNRLAFNHAGQPLFVLKNFIKLSGPPVPVAERVQAELPEITQDIEQSIAQVLAAKGEADKVARSG